MRWASNKPYLERLMNEVLVSISCFFIYVHPPHHIFSAWSNVHWCYWPFTSHVYHRLYLFKWPFIWYPSPYLDVIITNIRNDNNTIILKKSYDVLLKNIDHQWVNQALSLYIIGILLSVIFLFNRAAQVIFMYLMHRNMRDELYCDKRGGTASLGLCSNC